MKRILLMLIVLVVALGFVSAQAEVEYPARDITNILVWGAGGGTDTANRLVMAEMAKELGVNVNVNNVTGGVGGSVGMYEAFAKPADGYTLCGLSESVVTAAVQGGFGNRMNVWDFFIIGGSPDLVSVTPNAPYNTIAELVEAAKKNPKSIRAGSSAAGSIHHLNLLAFEKGSGAQFNFIPYDSSAASQNAAMTGEVTLVITSVQEQAELLKAGKLRPLGMLIPEDFDFMGKKIPSAFKAYPGLSEYLPLEQQIGFAIRKDAPEAVKTKLQQAFKVAMTADPIKKFGAERYFTLKGLVGKEANDIFDKLESVFSWTLWDLGAAKVNPQTLGIPR
ncbi:MAG: tripartite tricarboxylate transporter substrate-binding protein [Sphaerochaeta sp.]|jgi:tripartite-type tricarboxylate transporter receptor subunit TctC|nr:tripartite tricarboxylate transporter substrate-binding protein [Sphaerochaeta sp.]PKL28814.1 MAG: tricarboxylate transport protein TctC [Spirochaetae bacterium HGW-Spirochaetae-2]